MSVLWVLAAVAASVAAVIAAWHLAVLAATAAARLLSGRDAGVPISGVRNFRVVDDRVWRGGRPDSQSYGRLAEQGVTTLIDMCEESSSSADELRRFGLGVCHLPVIDGTLPTPEQVTVALDAIQRSAGRTYIHCAAGVGRTGTIVASYLLADGTSRWRVLLHNLGVGPPSLAQMVFVVTAPGPPHRLIVAASRVLDAPRVCLGRARQWLRSSQ